jgi:hypothetical protein
MSTLRWKAIKCEKCLCIHKNQLQEIVQMNAHFVFKKEIELKYFIHLQQDQEHKPSCNHWQV